MMVWIGFSYNADDNIFNRQEIDLINELSKLDNDNVKTFLCNVQKPGGNGPGEIIIFKAEMNFCPTVSFIHNKNRKIGWWNTVTSPYQIFVP